MASKIGQIQSLTSIDTALRATTRPAGDKLCTFECVPFGDLNLWYDDKIEHRFEGVVSSGIGNWDIQYGTLVWDDYAKSINCRFTASYSSSTLSGNVAATTDTGSNPDIPVISANITTHEGHPAVDITLSVESLIHWWTFGGTSETARVIVYCTSWRDRIETIGGDSVGYIYYNT